MINFKDEVALLYTQFEELKKCNTKIKKEEKLKELSKDSTFCFVLEFLLNNNKPSGIGKAKLKKKISDKKMPEATFNSDVKTLFEYIIRNNNSMNDIDIWRIQNCIKEINVPEHYNFISELITKTYSCGTSDLTAHEFIPQIERNWRIRKGHALKKYKQIENKKVVVSLKLDGFRYVAIKKDNAVTFYSTSGTEIKGLIDIEAELLSFPDGVYDGECIAVGDFDNSTDRFNATSKILGKDGIKQGVEFVVFDYVEDIDAFLDYGKITVGRKDRLDNLRNILKDKNSKFIKLVEVYIDNKLVDETVYKEIIDKYEEVTNQGEEGLIIDIADAPYVRAKGTSMFKLKPEVSGDFKVVGLKEGTGKDAGRLGSFIIEYKTNTVNVGSGLTDSIREEVWTDKEKYIGKLIEVVYFGETQDEKTGELSLRLPRFKRFRFDKNDMSYD